MPFKYLNWYDKLPVSLFAQMACVSGLMNANLRACNIELEVVSYALLTHPNERTLFNPPSLGRLKYFS
jgi:hypothetical protein